MQATPAHCRQAIWHYTEGATYLPTAAMALSPVLMDPHTHGTLGAWQSMATYSCQQPFCKAAV